LPQLKNGAEEVFRHIYLVDGENIREGEREKEF
jgi:hypothetical protein